MAMTEKWIPSPNYSAGRNAVTKIVLHTTEGAQTIESLGSFFSNRSAGVSSHFGADNKVRGTVGAYVYESNTAWTQGNANSWCISNELCTPSGAASGWSRDYWLNNQKTLIYNAADWVGWMCRKYGIPIRAMTSAQAQDPNYKGVCEHKNFGSWGGGHVDCGSGFPMDKVIEWATNGCPDGSKPPVTSPGPTPPGTAKPVQEDEMPVAIPPGPDAPHVGVSFSGTPYKTIGFCGDATVFKEVITIRCAFHKAGTGASWSVQTAYVDRGHNKVVINIPAGTDGVSFRRQDNEPCIIYPNFGT